MLRSGPAIFIPRARKRVASETRNNRAERFSISVLISTDHAKPRSGRLCRPAVGSQWIGKVTGKQARNRSFPGRRISLTGIGAGPSTNGARRAKRPATDPSAVAAIGPQAVAYDARARPAGIAGPPCSPHALTPFFANLPMTAQGGPPSTVVSCETYPATCRECRHSPLPSDPGLNRIQRWLSL